MYITHSIRTLTVLGIDKKVKSHNDFLRVSSWECSLTCWPKTPWISISITILEKTISQSITHTPLDLLTVVIKSSGLIKFVPCYE